MVIDCYDFGFICIDGREYQSDVLILPSGIRGWWRREGHKLSLADLEQALAERPEVLIIGSGTYQAMQVPAEIQQLQSRGIEVLVQATDRACQTYNQLHTSRRVAAALHLTC